MKTSSHVKFLFTAGLCILLQATVTLNAQPTTFVKTYNNGDVGYAVREVNGNSYVVAGGTDFYFNYHWMTMSAPSTTDIHIYKTDISGALIWEKQYGNNNSRSMARWIEPTTDGGFILTGYENKEVTWPPDSNDIFFTKTDANGVITWSKTFDTGKDELAFCVRQTFDGGYIIAAFNDMVPTSLLGNTYAMLIKTDANGNISWTQKYQIVVRDFDTFEAFPVIVRQCADSGYVLTGTTSGIHQADIFVLRTNATGNVLWAKSYEHDNSSIRFSTGQDIIEDAAGNFVVAASLDKDRSMFQYNYPFIMKVSATGVLLLQTLYDSNPFQNFQSGFSSVEQIPGNGYFFTGMGGYAGFGFQAQLIKTDVNFNMQWSRSYSWDGIATIGSRCARHTSDGGYIFTGKRQMSGSILMKTDGNGMVPCKNPGFMLPLTASMLTVNRTPAISSGISSSVLLLNTQVILMDTATLCPNTGFTLPVEMISFKAKLIAPNKIQLNWITASEKDNDYFSVERSVDGNNFLETGRVAGNGNTRTSSSYSYVDLFSSDEKIIYFRLKQVDFNGSENFTKIIPLNLLKDGMELIACYADLASQNISLTIFAAEDLTLTYRLTDIMGHEVFSGNTNINSGATQYLINAAGLKHGIYFYQVNTATQNFTGKIFY